MVSQVTVVGILMIVNGGLQMLYGVIMALVGPFMLTMIGRQAAAPPQAQEVFTIISVVYLVVGVVVAICGVMNVAGGIAALRFRSRAFVLTALFFNIIPVFTVYCTLTSLGVAIYGLIVMFQTDVAEAFALAGQGYSPEEIKRRAARSRYGPRDDYYDDGYDERRRGPERRPQTERPPLKGEAGEEGIQESH